MSAGASSHGAAQAQQAQGGVMAGNFNDANTGMGMGMGTGMGMDAGGFGGGGAYDGFPGNVGSPGFDSVGPGVGGGAGFGGDGALAPYGGQIDMATGQPVTMMGPGGAPRAR